ncbi:phosphoribosylformylglycinamidine synthase [Caldanaerobius fijiensis DSM 17918]|uniref:Phosphoribosylformylglycinamidine synthase subunit PurS n=2 Tax=Caldanaerobius TaxID=862261 RepID=A0A1M5A6Q5_9THEO|nr:phosphoribosylformylglycinamidine synthase subunit PurS [Caldanaerobius fijiensis]SHF25834.1 phosphoribosylformylglycinamidine synthase [Caldanaerobius fijiensis DSM 17918]
MIAKIKVTLKKGISDPQGQAIKGSLQTLGFGNVQDVRVGKYIEILIDEQEMKTAEEKVKEMCEKLLANPVIEDYTFEITEV